MAYRITGIDPADFAPLFAMSDDALAAHGAIRMSATADRGFPCRVSLRDAAMGEELLLLNHVSHDVATPYRSAYAIYVRAAADRPACFIDVTPPVFEGRPIALRAFDAAGMLRDAALVLPGDGAAQADRAIRALFAVDAIAYIHAHNAAHGCFSARIERHG